MWSISHFYLMPSKYSIHRYILPLSWCCPRYSDMPNGKIMAYWYRTCFPTRFKFDCVKTTISRLHHFWHVWPDMPQKEILSGDPIFFLAKNHPLCRMWPPWRTGYNFMVVWWESSVANCDPANVQESSETISGTFSLTNLEEEVWIGITTHNRDSPIKCNSSLFIHRSIIEVLMTQDQCYQMDSAQSHYFMSLFIYQLMKKITTKIPMQIIFYIQTTYYKFILHSTASFRYSFNICLMRHLSALINWKTEHFQHNQVE